MESSWKDLAGTGSNLSLLVISREPDSILLAELATTHLRFNSAGCTEFAERYLRDQSGSTRQLKRWADSRRALLQALAALKEDISPSEVLASLSHTQHQCIAVTTVRSAAVQGVGVDVEERTRELSMRAAERFMRASEHSLSLTPLQVWTIKEACYKADAGNQNSLISQYEIVSFANGKAEVRSDQNAQAHFTARCLETAELMVSFAVRTSPGAP